MQSTAEQLIFMATCAAGTERAVLHEILEKVRAVVRCGAVWCSKVCVALRLTACVPFGPNTLSPTRSLILFLCLTYASPSLPFTPALVVCCLCRGKVKGRICGPFMPVSMTAQEKLAMIESRRLQKPHKCDFSVKDTFLPHDDAVRKFQQGDAQVAVESGSLTLKQEAYLLADNLTQEGVVLFTTDAPAHAVIRTLRLCFCVCIPFIVSVVDVAACACASFNLVWVHVWFHV